VLQKSVSARNISIVKLLLDHGADINSKDCGGQSVLSSAVIYNSDESIVRLLLEHGADIHAKDYYGKSVLAGSVVQKSVSGGNISIVKLLLDHGAEVNSTDRFGDSALSDAVRQWDRNQYIVRLLLAYGADQSALTDEEKEYVAVLLNSTEVE
jgi:ankyrin repeat protein